MPKDGSAVTPKDIVNAFIQAINHGDTSAIYHLMSPDHKFTDAEAKVVLGQEQMGRGWIAYLKMVPDYRICVSEVLDSGNTVVVLGKASGTYTADGILKRENYWETPAAWRVAGTV